MQWLENFGRGHLDLEGIDLGNTNPTQQAEYFGGKVGCPSVPSLVNERGAEIMAKRYAEILLYYSLMIETVEKVRPDIAAQIEGPLDRIPGEPLAVYDDTWIPVENLSKVPGPETPWGYALPRLVTAYMRESNTEGDLGDRLSRALTYFDDVLASLENGDNAHSLLLKFAEKLATKGKANAQLILKRTISQGKMEQDSFYTYFQEVITDMKNTAPTLFASYEALNDQQKKDLGIANPFVRR